MTIEASLFPNNQGGKPWKTTFSVRLASSTKTISVMINCNHHRERVPGDHIEYRPRACDETCTQQFYITLDGPLSYDDKQAYVGLSQGEMLEFFRAFLMASEELNRLNEELGGKVNDKDSET